MSLTVDSLLIELGQMCGVRGELDTDSRIDLLGALEATLRILDTARVWRYQLATGSFTLGGAVSGITTAEPTTTIVDATRSPFKAHMAYSVPRIVTFPATGHTYNVVSVPLASAIEVDGDASGEGSGAAFTVNGRTDYDWDNASLCNLRDLGKIFSLYFHSPIDQRLILRDKKFYRDNLLPIDSSPDYPQYYWETGERTFSIWPEPSEDITCYVDYARHHGNVGEDTTIFFPEKWKTVLLRMARQVYKSQAQTIDQATANDGILTMLYQQMAADQTSKDRSAGMGLAGNKYNVRVTHDYAADIANGVV